VASEALHIKKGQNAEHWARNYLKDRGYTIVQTNFRCRLGEIDIVAQDADSMYFVEVKGRWSSKYGSPIDQVTDRKMRHISRVAAYYLIKFPHCQERHIYLSVLGVDYSVHPPVLQWMPDAFDYVGERFL
jgi:putative endonuclease